MSPNGDIAWLDKYLYLRGVKIPVTIVLDNVRSANNVGAFFRTADSLGASRIVLCGITAVPPSRDIHKTALGAELTVDWEHEQETIRAIEKLRAEGVFVVAVEQAPGAVLLQDFEVDAARRYALVFGNEVEGIPYNITEACDACVELPQEGAKKSLNVAVCGGITLWEFYKKILCQQKQN